MSKPATVEPRGPEYKQFGENLAALRKARGLSQSDICLQLGVIQSTYAGWETGTRKVQLATIILLSKYFGVSADVLIGIKEFVLPEPAKDNFGLKESEKSFVLKYRTLNKDGQSRLSERADELLDLGYVQKGDAQKMA